MATKLVNPPISSSQVGHLFIFDRVGRMMMMRSQRALPFTHSRSKNYTRFKGEPSGFRPIFSIRDSQKSSGMAGDAVEVVEGRSEYKTVAQIKEELYEALQGINRGIFGVPSEKRSQIECLVKVLESQNPTPDPILYLDKLKGCWKVIYSTITILGSKRTKLGLRDFISLGEFFQIVDITEGKAVNVIKFSARGLNLLNGELRIEASFKIASNSRVDIQYCDSEITPTQLMNVFRKSYDLLLGIFNPEGWLEITYVDDDLRIGRDDKSNIFILERSEENKP